MQTEVVDHTKIDLVKTAEKFLFGSKTVDGKVASLRNFALTLYAGGEEDSQFAAKLLPHIMLLFEETNVPRQLLLQILQTLSMMAHHNAETSRLILKQDKTMRKIIRCIDDVKHVAECRWACYLLSVIAGANRQLTMETIGKYPDLQESLQKASEFSANWEGWFGNLAMFLLNLEVLDDLE